MSEITSELRQFVYENGEIQRVQIVRFGDFQNLRFFRPSYDPASFTKLCQLYRDFIIRKYAMVYGKIVIFTLDGEEIPFSKETEDGTILDPLAVVTREFQKHIQCVHGKLRFSDEKVRAYFEKLTQNECLYVAEGNRNSVAFLPVGKEMGFLSQSETKADLKVNASFFVFDQLDCGSVFDCVGTPVGLMVEDGRILNPPQFGREVFMVTKDGETSIGEVSLQELTVKIGQESYRHGENAVFFERPASRRTPKGKVDLVVMHNRVVAVNARGGSEVPCGGFVIQIAAGNRSLPDILESIGDGRVSYEGLENLSFAIQVGNSAVVEGEPTEAFQSPFYNFLQFWKTAYPPSMYPLNYEKARAPRIVLGADKEGRGMLLWHEGAGKFGYVPGVGSCGASLQEAARIAAEVGMVNGVHLDGGGSAQILVKGEKSLQISDRDPSDYSEKERAVPVGLMLIDSLGISNPQLSTSEK